MDRDKLNCPNCGAPIRDVECPYCGTLFYDFANLELGKKSYIRMKIDGKLCVFDAILLSATINNDIDTVDIETRSGMKIPFVGARTSTLDLSMRVTPTDNNIFYKIYTGKE